MSEPVIRDARPGDRTAIQAVTLAACEEYAARMRPGLWPVYRQNIVETLATPAPAVQLVAVAARGRGLGTALMRECMARAHASGATTLSLHTTDLMRVAMAMYERMGFVRAPEIDLTPSPGVVIKGYRLDLGGR